MSRVAPLSQQPALNRPSLSLRTSTLDASDEAGIRVTIRRHGRSKPATWQELHSLDWSNFGLVLGGGGVTGLAFEAGVLLGLSVDHGVELSAANELVGTSAGSIVAAFIALGLDSGDLAALVAGVPEEFSSRAIGLHPWFEPEVTPAMPHLLKILRPQGPRDMFTLTRFALRRQYRAAMLHLLRDGSFDMRASIGFFDGQPWPRDLRLRICVTNASSGSRVLLGADDGIELVDAVLASCAVPTVMRSVHIGPHSYLDGGVVSPTSADVLAGDPACELVVVVSPMSGNAARTVPGRVGSHFAAGRLRRELTAFDPDQTVVVIEPVGDLSKLVVDDSLSGGAVKEILRSAFTLASYGGDR